jgi:tetratricopeptide (TPR) repeat protein
MFQFKPKFECKSLFKKIWVVFFCIVFLGCSSVAVFMAPKKLALQKRTSEAEKVDEEFWRVLHQGRYEDLPKLIEQLTAVYLRTPHDSITAAHLGFSHIWYVAERERQEKIPARITDHVILARKYFEEAVQLNPSEDRYLGFLGASLLAEATIHQDERLKRKGYFTLRESIDHWPEFNLFTGGYMLSGLPFDSPQFSEALEWQWQALDACAETRVDRKNPDFSRYLSLKTNHGRKRVCWNSWIAPHNFEGFFLNMGDMLVKKGELEAAKKIYANARLSESYSQWKFKDTLEQRIIESDQNVSRFRFVPHPLKRDRGKERKIMFHSDFACMACHQQ